MEFKEYLKIIKNNNKIFFTVWVSILFLALFTVGVQPLIYEGEMTMTIIRDNKNLEIKVSEEYDYHYQLEANRKFAEILARAVEDKAILDRSLTGEIDGHKLAITKKERTWISSRVKGTVLGAGYVKIDIEGHDEKALKQIGARLAKQLTYKISKLGLDKSRPLRVEIEPIIIAPKGKLYLPVGLGAFFGGILIAIFVVLVRHYWREEE